MKMVTVSQAKSRLSAYIKFAEAGEEVVIMRGSKPAVVLRPISEEELNVTPEIPLSALKKFEEEIERDIEAGTAIKVGDSPAEAAANLRRLLKARK
jgi:prevent-host-death family protein